MDVKRKPLPLSFLFLSMCATLPLPVRAQSVVGRPLVVGYFGQWGLYNSPPYTLKDLASNNKVELLDQLNYAQAFVTGGHCSIADRNADLDHLFAASESVDGQPDNLAAAFRGHLHQLAKLKRAHPRLKAFISLEGRAADFALDAQPENRQAFVASCVDLFIRGNLEPNISAPGLFDGIDVDWEYPQGADAANFLALLTEFRRQMNLVRPGLMLSIAVGPSPRMYDGTDFRAIAAAVDEVGLMTYDQAGPWMQTTGFIAPLYNVPQQSDVPSRNDPIPRNDASPLPHAPAGADRTASTSVSGIAAAPAGKVASSLPAPAPPPSGGTAGSVQAFLAAGVPAAKVLMGIPFYGYGWTQVPEVENGVFQEGTPVRGDRPYSYIQSLAATSSAYRDPVSRTPWLFDGDAFWTFDDAVSIEAKANYAIDHHLGGIMIWELSDDTPQATLLTAAHHALNRPPSVASAQK